jgi:hypothetical protein
MDNLVTPALLNALASAPSPVLLLIAALQAYEISRLGRSLERTERIKNEKIFRLIEANELQTAVIRDLATEVAFVRTRVEELSYRTDHYHR